MSECKVIQAMKRALDAGVSPENVVPWSFQCSNKDEFIEVLYYSIQILPDGRRKEELKKKLEEVTANAGR